jgi:hypothetical protein
VVADIDGCARWRCYDDDEENWRRGKVLLLEERELTVARVSGTIKQVKRRGVFFLPTSSTVFSYLSVLFFFFLFSFSVGFCLSVFFFFLLLCTSW